MDLLIAGSSVGLALVLCVTFYLVRNSRPAFNREVERRMTRPEDAPAEDIARTDARPTDRRPVLASISRLHLLRGLEESMWQAGIYARVADALLIMLALFTAGMLGGVAVWGDPLIALGLAVAAGACPLIYIRLRSQRRLKAFTRQLPFALDLIRSSLEAGHSLLRGFQVVVAEFADPIGSEFRSVIEQSRLGLPLPRALEEMLKRVPVDDLRLLVVAVRVQSEVGSSLAQIIARLSEIVRTRQRLKEQIRALTAQSRMSGMIVGCLPIVILAAFSVLQPQYTYTLFHDPMGIRILKTAIVLDLIGFCVIRKLIKVTY